jgi:hypothetical protein
MAGSGQYSVFVQIFVKLNLSTRPMAFYAGFRWQQTVHHDAG